MSKQFILNAGDKIFELNLITGLIVEASYFKISKVERRLIEKKDCIYLKAKNKQHSKIKFNKIITGALNS